MWTLFDPSVPLSTKFFSPGWKLFTTYDHSQPHMPYEDMPACYKGTCTASNENFAMTVSGPSEAIADLTEEGGWVETRCHFDSPNKIHMTCNDKKLCDLLRVHGPLGKVVRVPFECSESGFAMLTALSEAIPDPLFGVSYDGEIDATFKSKPLKPHTVNFSFKALTEEDKNAPNSKRGFHMTSMQTQRRIPDDPTLIDKHHQEHFTKSLKDFQLISYNPACKTREDKDKWKRWLPPAETPTRTFRDAKARVAVTGQFSMNASVEVDMNMAAGVSVLGSLVPRNIQKAILYASINGTLQGSLKLAGALEGVLKTEDITVVHIPLVTFAHIPAIFSVGPAFEVLVRPEIKANLSVEQEIGFGFEFKDLRMFFPEGQGRNKSGGSAELLPTHQSLKLGSGQANIEASFHIIPRLSFGATFLDTKTEAYIEVDISGIAGLSLEKIKELTPEPKPNQDSGVKERDSVKRAELSNAVARRDSNFFQDNGLRGCAYVNLAVALNIGANLDYLKMAGILDTDPKTTLKEWPFEIVRNCTDDAEKAGYNIPKPDIDVVSDGGGGSWRRSLARTSLQRRAAMKSSDIKCRLFRPGTLQGVYSMTANGAKVLSQVGT